MTNAIIKTPHFPSIMGRTVFDQIFDQFFEEPKNIVRRSTEGYPLTDIYKSQDDDQVIEMALAGFSKDDLNIEVKENSISISCNSNGEWGEGENYRRIARRSFQKSFVDYDNKLDLKKATASFENGLLKVTIPTIADKKPTIIAIE
jgi:molecular chaperone IbpA